MASVLRSLRSGSSSAASFARANRSNPQVLRSSRRQYSSPKQSRPKVEEPVLPPLSEMMSRKSIMAAWSGGVGEFQLMKKFVLEPAKERKRLKEEEEALKAKLNVAGGEDKAVLLGSS
ncbi:hypothetical protein L198_05134 [Cryptococcus wingfieldii CBS 7118]|uniref:Uncharacterized protein n=1 Tax=Cryptococcus wingfieldii CBS 7118 TaxID=1295528 RepID=A0A1E3J0D4_9TREE|nr:hypothetical protein L198_05134 [Cryptococcus wingfieldii CBS 7118]ODN94278.1 hypothetical protein L198_05134 [Cryptococcus wingfieldii CBS 7118]